MNNKFEKKIAMLSDRARIRKVVKLLPTYLQKGVCLSHFHSNRWVWIIFTTTFLKEKVAQLASE
jgi:hypothetical protein